MARCRQQERHGQFPHALVGDADDGRLGDTGIGQQVLFDFRRAHVEAASDEHVLEAVGDAQNTSKPRNTEIEACSNGMSSICGLMATRLT